MTTKNSPERALRTQATQIAEALKDQSANPRVQSRAGPTVKAGIVMDDKTLIVEIPWATIRATSVAGLDEYVYDLMRETDRGHPA